MTLSVAKDCSVRLPEFMVSPPKTLSVPPSMFSGPLRVSAPLKVWLPPVIVSEGRLLTLIVPPPRVSAPVPVSTKLPALLLKAKLLTASVPAVASIVPLFCSVL